MSRIPWSIVFLALLTSFIHAAPREEWGAVPVTVPRDGANWILTGRKKTVTLEASDRTIDIDSPKAHWKTLPPTANDLVVKRQGQTFNLDLRDARKVVVEPYDTGYGNGVKITLGDWEKAPDLKLFLTFSLEGEDEELAFGIVAVEGETRIDRLDWPPAMDAR